MTLILKEIWIYPIKSLAGIKLQRGVVQKKGLQYDRRWMLIDEKRVAMTQRVYPQMALFKPRIEGSTIEIAYTRGGNMLSSSAFDMSAVPNGEKITAQIWNDQVEVFEVDGGISAWFSRHLGTPCTLVAFPETNPRPVDPRYSIADDHVSLADAYPFLLIGQASLDDLNSRLPEPVPMNRFRPNFVVTGGPPFVEDTWKDLLIGHIPFVAAKKSDRCVLTTVNQDTAEKGPEPLRTLSGYRKVERNVYFGQNLIAQGEGTVAVGEDVIPA